LLVAVTDHAAERFRQRVRGTLEAKQEVASRVARARAAGRTEAGERGTLLVRDLERPGLVYVCRPGEQELVVVHKLLLEGAEDEYWRRANRVGRIMGRGMGRRLL